jgi:hypothetical protein
MDVSVTPEIKEFLLSRMPFSPTATVEYTPTVYTRTKDVEGVPVPILPPELTPSFSLRSLRKDEKEKLRKLLQNINDHQEEIKEICRKTVLGWKRIYDLGLSEGSEALVEYEYKADPNGGCEKECFGYLPTSVVSDICFYLSKISGLLDLDKVGL